MTDSIDAYRAALMATQMEASSFYSVQETAKMLSTFFRHLPEWVLVGDTNFGIANDIEEAARSIERDRSRVSRNAP